MNHLASIYLSIYLLYLTPTVVPTPTNQLVGWGIKAHSTKLFRFHNETVINNEPLLIVLHFASTQHVLEPPKEPFSSISFNLVRSPLGSYPLHAVRALVSSSETVFVFCTFPAIMFLTQFARAIHLQTSNLEQRNLQEFTNSRDLSQNALRAAFAR